jgi:integrase
LLLTGCRRSEIAGLKAGDIVLSSGLFYTYRGKGGKQAKRELPRPAFNAIQQALAAWGKTIHEMDPSQSIWPSLSRDKTGITSGTLIDRHRDSLIVRS